jgi:hypothetical protein
LVPVFEFLIFDEECCVEIDDLSSTKSNPLSIDLFGKGEANICGLKNLG